MAEKAVCLIDPGKQKESKKKGLDSPNLFWGHLLNGHSSTRTSPTSWESHRHRAIVWGSIKGTGYASFKLAVCLSGRVTCKQQAALKPHPINEWMNEFQALRHLFFLPSSDCSTRKTGPELSHLLGAVSASAKRSTVSLASFPALCTAKNTSSCVFLPQHESVLLLVHTTVCADVSLLIFSATEPPSQYPVGFVFLESCSLQGPRSWHLLKAVEGKK